jgi:aspartyl-tRNA(Asn)/glutamyl-tRNA(Gln) amidotransferase subunit A
VTGGPRTDPTETPLWARDAWEIADDVRAGRLSATAVVAAHLDRIAQLDPPLRSFVEVDAEAAMLRAAEVDVAVAGGGDPGPLAGVPLGVKDLEDAAGLPTRRGSLLLRQVPPADQDSIQVARLRAAGAVVVGKTATPEFGSLAFTWSPAFGTTRSPWQHNRTPGGSSGGSGAALAAGLVPLATGSDGAGSIRIPASFCGLVGLKTSTGLVPRLPRRGVAVPLSIAGPMGRSVRDVARALDQVAGLHRADPLAVPRPVPSYEQALGTEGLRGLRVAWSPRLGCCDCDPEVEAIARAGAERLLAATGMVEVDAIAQAGAVPDGSSAWATLFSVDALAELHELWPARAGEMTPVVAAMLTIGESATSADLAAAGRLRHDVVQAANRLFEQVDLLVTPTMPIAAFDAEGPMPQEIGGRDVDGPFATVCFVVPFNLTGHPAVSVPAGLTHDGLPVGLQIAGPRLSEARLLAAAHAFEQAHPWPKLAPAYSF